MSLRAQLWLLILAPMVIIGSIIILGMTIPVPEIGRGYVLRFPLPNRNAIPGLPPVLGPEDASRPLVVIDAGHGGHDPGASGESNLEKDLVLGLAHALRDRLLQAGGVRVALTRDDDRYLVLGDRAEIARQLGADLFLSVHADSAGEKSGIQGASIYTLSSRASSQAAERFAERENSSNRINGVELADADADVSAILVDLSQRRAQDESKEFARLIVREGAGTLRFHPEPLRSASLVVLKAPDVPSVLYEAGYISNSEDAARLASDAGRERFAEVMSRAIQIYFARNIPEEQELDGRIGTGAQ